MLQPIKRSVQLVCKLYDVPVDQLVHSPLRSERLAHPRFIAYWLSHKLGASHSHISYHLRRGRLGVRKGCLRVDEWRADDPAFKVATDAMLTELAAHEHSSNHVQPCLVPAAPVDQQV